MVLVKNYKILSSSILSKASFEVMFSDILARKQAFQNNKNITCLRST